MKLPTHPVAGTLSCSRPKTYRSLAMRGDFVDPELGVLAAAAAATLVQLLATDLWTKGKDAMGTLWRRMRPDRAERIEASLADSREDLLAARECGDDATGQVLVSQWEAQLRGLLVAQPEAAGLLRELLDHTLRPALIAVTGPQATTTTTTIRADARDHSQSFAAGGNITVHTAPPGA